MKTFALALVLASVSMLSHANDVRVDLGGVSIQAPGVTVTFGSRDNRGYYWDGHGYRDPGYWRTHNGPRGPKYYTGHGKKGGTHHGGHHCPPGQAKKGNC